MCGGRNFSDFYKLTEVLNEYNVVAFCHGAASGADSLCARYASLAGIPATPFPADWSGPCGQWCSPGHRMPRGDGDYCPAAGVYRNIRMLDEFKPDLVVAFTGGKGTKDMVMRAVVRGVEVRTVW